MEEKVGDEIKTEKSQDEKEVEEKINEETENTKEDQLRELKIGEFQEIFDPIKSAFDEEAKKDEFFRNDNLNSLVLVNENKNKMLDNLRKTWNEQHFRVQDFKHKKLLKYPQIFYFTMGLLFDSEKKIIEQKTSTLTKYTFNLDDYSEIDVGGSMTSRNSLGLGSLFCGYRFSLMNDRLFNYISYTGGDNRKLFYELNYMPNDNTLLDYIYKRKIDDEFIPVVRDLQKVDLPGEPDIMNNTDNPDFVNFKHYFTVHKLLSTKANKVSFGIIRDNKNFHLNFSQKHSIQKETSIRTGFKLSSDNLTLKNKIKHKLNDSFYCESEQNLKYDGVGLNVFNNRLFYKNNSNIFSLGGFFSSDGVGLEFGYRFGGVHLKLPFLIWQSDYNSRELAEKNLLFSLIEYTIFGFLSAGVNVAFKFILSKIAQLRKMKMKRLINKSVIVERREKVLQMKKEFFKSLEVLGKSAERYHSLELDKKEKGLIIHLALYGKFEKLETYKKDFDYISNKFKNAKAKNINTNTDEFNIPMKIKEYKIDEECDNIENEIINVTLSVRNKISSKGQNTYSSILFREPTKTSIFGFFNPIFKTEEMPQFLIIYEIQGEIRVTMKKDSEIFQIPEEILIKNIQPSDN